MACSAKSRLSCMCYFTVELQKRSAWRHENILATFGQYLTVPVEKGFKHSSFEQHVKLSLQEMEIVDSNKHVFSEKCNSSVNEFTIMDYRAKIIQSYRFIEASLQLNES